MYGPAIPVVMLMSLVFCFSTTAFRRGRALRKRGVRTDAKCVEKERDAKGIVFLHMRFTTETGRSVAARVGPYRIAPANVGGVIEVVYDPRDLSNVETPAKMMTGRVSLPVAVVSGFALAFWLLVLFSGE